MSTYDYDLFVIGAGSGGVRAGRIAATHGAKVGMAEERYLGGTCVNVGCVPKKLFVYGSHYKHDFHESHGFGWDTPSDISFNWKRLVENKDKEITRLNGVYERMLKGAGVDIINGTATIADPNTVVVNDKKYTAKKILVAVGGWPFTPDIPGKELAITSNEVFHLKELPKRAIIVGGGYIAVEFTGIMHAFGVQVTQVYRGDMFLRGFDDDVRCHLKSEMDKQGVDVRFNTDISKLEKLPSGAILATLKDGSTMETDLVMYATGRVAKTSGLGLEAAGVTVLPSGVVPVDEFSQTNVASVYCVGDATDRINLTPVALHEGHCFADTVFNNNPRKPCHDLVASAVFSNPPIGSCGLTEAQAVKSFGADGIDVYRSVFRPLKHTVSGSEEKALMKLIVDKASDRVVGLHMCGAEAGETVQGFAVAMKCGATKAQFDSTIGIHPTAAEEFVTMRTPVSKI